MRGKENTDIIRRKKKEQEQKQGMIKVKKNNIEGKKIQK